MTILQTIYNEYQNGHTNRCGAIQKLAEYIDAKRGKPDDFELFVAEAMLRMFAQR